MTSKTLATSQYSHVSATTKFVAASGIRYAYRCFGPEKGTPLVFLQHFRGGMDNWDPAVTDGLVANRPVILFDNTGVAGSSDETPDTVKAQADDAATFIRALGLIQVDVLGSSIGGYVAQALTLGTAIWYAGSSSAGPKPRAGDDTDRHPDVNTVATRHEVLTLKDFLPADRLSGLRPRRAFPISRPVRHARRPFPRRDGRFYLMRHDG